MSYIGTNDYPVTHAVVGGFSDPLPPLDPILLNDSKIITLSISLTIIRKGPGASQRQSYRDRDRDRDRESLRIEWGGGGGVTESSNNSMSDWGVICTYI